MSMIDEGLLITLVLLHHLAMSMTGMDVRHMITIVDAARLLLENETNRLPLPTNMRLELLAIALRHLI